MTIRRHVGLATFLVLTLVGAALLTLLPQLLASFHDYQDIAVGLIIMLSMIFLRQGIIPSMTAALAGRRT